MDINSLLSPSESPRSTPGPAARAPAKKTRRSRATSNLSVEFEPTTTTGAPFSQAASSLPKNGGSQPHNAATNPGAMTAAQGLRPQAAVTPPGDAHPGSRQPSTPGMDALADLASMQHHQQTARANAGGLRNTEIYDNQATTAGTLPTIPAISRSQATAQLLRGTSFDRSMVDAPTQTPSPRQYTTSSLSESEQETVTRLAAHLVANPFAYEAHVQLINILHQGLVNHKSPRSYDLLRDLQNAREAMSSRFGLGEDLLADWVQDEILLAETLDARISVMELCQRTVEEEPNSTKLWRIYGDWMLSLYKHANGYDERLADIGPPLDGLAWPEEDRAVAREIISWQLVMDVWRRGASATMLMINDSQLLWDTFTELRLAELASSPPLEALANLEKDFQKRLQVPHATWDQTFQAYSTFINRYDNQNYEETMVTVKKSTAQARKKYVVRELKELAVLRARQTSDREGELRAFTEYIDYETGLSRKKNHFDFDLLTALYQRATVRFPANTELWEAFVMFYNDELAVHGRRNVSAIPVLEQATRHCPWSGNLWAQYLLAAEIEKMPFASIGQIKHKATSTGLLDSGSIDEILKVHTAWCGFLRRRAFQEGATDEDSDVAEMGIRSAIEDMNTAGTAKYGKEFQGDPEYRLEKIYIKYLTQGRQWDAARDAWKKLAHKKGDSYDFWLRYYVWEMTTWCKLAFRENSPEGGKFIKPTEATKVLQQALRLPNLDWPEKIIETFHYHCEDHEDAAELQSAIVQISKAEKVVKQRREKEAYAAYEAAQVELAQQQQQQPNTAQIETVDSTEENGAGKRKREEESHDGPSKRIREHPNQAEPQVPEQGFSAPPIPKRDRENATVVVKNLPVATTETRVRQYFRDCGTINSLKVLSEPDGNSATASIEFESKDDVLTAQTKDMKTFDGNAIEVQVGGSSTIYVCNFPPTADELWIREKFQPFGEIVDIRFPSLKYNTHRRFCYIQFRLASQAQAATQLDGDDQGDDLKLLAKMSDPNQKKAREGAMYEGREIFLGNLDWGASEKEVKQFFKKYGYVESARILRKPDGKPKGLGFVKFRDKEAATAALETNLQMFRNRLLNVTMSTNDKSKRPQLVTEGSTSQRATMSPAPNRQDTPNGDAASPLSTSSAPTKDNAAKIAEMESRTLVLLNIPDTVNDARTRALCDKFSDNDVRSVRLRPSHSGAIVEFNHAASVGKASLGLEGHEIAPGRLLRVGTVAELKKMKGDYHSDKLSDRPKMSQSQLQPAAPIRRPGQPVARRGGKGGLGTKRGGAASSTSRPSEGAKAAGTTRDGDAKDASIDGDSAPEATAPKSNADFRAMLEKK